MKTITVKTTTENSNATDKKTENNYINTEKINGMPLSKVFENGKTDAETKKEETTAPVTEQLKEQAPKVEALLPVAETKPVQNEVKQEALTEIQFEKPVLNLEGTLKLVEDLHRRKTQRDRLLYTIGVLEAFEVAQVDDADETEANHFQGCVLTIEDDQRRKFTTKNPVIIQAVAQFVNTMCVNRLAEIEAGIIIPA